MIQKGDEFNYKSMILLTVILDADRPFLKLNVVRVVSCEAASPLSISPSRFPLSGSLI